MSSGEPLLFNPDGGQVHGSREGPVPIVHLYGVTQEGHSVMVSAHGFTPYFFVSFPSSLSLNETLLGQMQAVLDQRVF